MKKLLKKLDRLRLEVEKLNSELSAKRKEYDEVKRKLLGKMNEAGMSSVSAGRVSISVIKTKRVSITDWKKLYKIMAKKGEFDLLQKRVSPTAILERVENGEKLPVEISTVRTLFVRKKHVKEK